MKRSINRSYTCKVPLEVNQGRRVFCKKEEVKKDISQNRVSYTLRIWLTWRGVRLHGWFLVPVLPRQGCAHKLAKCLHGGTTLEFSSCHKPNIPITPSFTSIGQVSSAARRSMP